MPNLKSQLENGKRNSSPISRFTDGTSCAAFSLGQLRLGVDYFLSGAVLIDILRKSFGGKVKGPLGRPPVVEHRHLLDAGDGAEFRAWFFGVILMLQVFARVFFERNARKAALLRAVMDEAVFADVQITRPRAAAPVIRTAVSQVVLKLIQPSELLLAMMPQLFIDLFLDPAEGFQLAAPVVNHAERRAEAEFDRA